MIPSASAQDLRLSVGGVRNNVYYHQHPVRLPQEACMALTFEDTEVHLEYEKNGKDSTILQEEEKNPHARNWTNTPKVKNRHSTVSSIKTAHPPFTQQIHSNQNFWTPHICWTLIFIQTYPSLLYTQTFVATDPNCNMPFHWPFIFNASDYKPVFLTPARSR